MPSPISLLRTYTTALSLTNDNMYPEIIDQVHREVPYLWWMSNRARAGGLMFESGGTKLKFDVVHAENTNRTAYYGFDTLTPSDTDEVTAGFEGWVSNAQMVAISLDEILENYGPEGIIKIAPTKYQIALMSMTGDVHRQLVQGVVGTPAGTADERCVAGTAPTGRTELLPLSYLIQKYDTATNLYVNADTIHSIAQPSGSTGQSWWRNQCLLSTADSFAKFRREMRNITHSCSQGSTNDAPDLGLCDQFYYELIESAVDHQRQYMDVPTTDMGFDNIKLGPTTFIIDHRLPNWGADLTAAMTLTQNSTNCGALYLNTNWLQLVVHEMAYFQPTPWVEAIDQTAIYSKIILKASHRMTQRRKHGVHYTVDGTIAV